MQLRATTSVTPGRKGNVSRLFGVPEFGVFMALVLAFAFFAILNDAMLSKLNILVTLRAVSYAGIVAVGMTLLLITREIDLSAGSVAGLSSIVAAWLMTSGGLPIPLALLLGLMTGMAAGLINGLTVVKLGVPSLIATLAMLFIARGFVFIITKGGYPIYPLPEAIGEFGAAPALGISWAFVIFIALAIVFDFILRRTIFGGMITATGGNKEAAMIAGIKIDQVKIACFILTGMLSAVAGMLVMARMKTGDSLIGLGWELDVITAVLVGGVSLAGGIGSVLGTVIGVVLLQVVRSGLVIVGVTAHLQNVAIGVILILAASLDIIRRGRKTE